MRPHSTDSVADHHTAGLHTGDVFVPAAWREPMQGILRAVAERCPVILLVGAEERGKTTFLACLGPAASVTAVPTDVIVVNGAPPSDWLAGLVAALDLSDISDGRDALIDELRGRLAERAERGAQLVIAVDDAHRLPPSGMAEVLTIAGGWPVERVPASVLLTGTSDLAERVAAVASLREARTYPRFSLAPWAIDDLSAFVRHRLAGQTPGHERFSQEAIARIHELSAGEPATVSRMVAGSLRLAQQAGELSVARTTVDSAVTSLTGDPRAPAVAAVATGPQSHRPERGGVAGIPGFADGAGQAPLHGPLPPTRAGRVVHPPFADAPPSTFAAPPRSYRRMIKIAAAALVLVIVAVALWSGLPGPDRGSGRIVVPPKLTATDQNQTGDGDSAAMELSRTGQPPLPSTPGTQLAAPAASVDPTPLPGGVGLAEPEAESLTPPTDADPGLTSGAAEEGTAELMQRGDALMLLSDVSTARQFYLLAARRGDPAAYTAVAGTYDPVFLQTSGVRGVRGDGMEAVAWYRQAMRHGDSLARPRLVSLLSHLRTTGEIDEVEAQRLLDGRS